MTLPAVNTGDALGLITGVSLAGLDLRRFECLPGCARCCGYKVSLLKEDINRLEAAGRSRDEFLDSEREPASGFADCLPKHDGFCVLLDSDKRCSMYAHRPLYCRLYPYIREAYVELQLDVDLSCPGVGRGKRTSDAKLAEIIASDGTASAHARLLESGRKAMRTAEQLLTFRGDQESLQELADCVRSAAEKGLAALRELLSAGTQDVRLDEAGSDLLRDYLVVWSKRQALWRWTDAFAVVTPAIPTRREAMFRFLLEMEGITRRRAGVIAGGRCAGRDAVLSAIREYDSFCRTYCQGFRLEA